MKKYLLPLALVLTSTVAMSTYAAAIDTLEVFVKTIKTGRAEFSQVVTSPPKNGQAPRTKTSQGTFEFARPHKFKFVYKKPFEQTIVADGQTLWLYDVDLNQVTARKQTDALGASPASLIASASDIKALEKDFALTNTAADKDGIEWVLATPKAKDNQLQSVRLGFKDGQLLVLDMLDSFGQRSVMRFGAFQPNVVFDSKTFEFTPPAGVDVIRQ